MGGAPNIDKYVPKECFIDYFSFTSVAELHEYLLAMKEEEWLSYIEAGKKYKRDEMDKTFGITSLYEQLMVVFKQSKQPFSLSIKSKARLFAHITEYLFIAIRYRLKQVINRIKI